jgi:hypothetical protein
MFLVECREEAARTFFHKAQVLPVGFSPELEAAALRNLAGPVQQVQQSLGLVGAGVVREAPKPRHRVGLCQRKPIHTPPAVRRVHHQHLCGPAPIHR